MTGMEVLSIKSGYIQTIDYESIVKITDTAHWGDSDLIEIMVKPGHFVLTCSPLARIYSRDVDKSQLAEDILSLIIIGQEPNPEQDLEFSIRQLVDIAIRALSPSINDPHTAISCIDCLSRNLEFFERTGGCSTDLINASEKRTVTRRVDSTSDLLAASFDQIRQYGAESVAVSIRLLETFSRLAKVFDDRDAIEMIYQQTLALEQALVDKTLADLDKKAIHDRAESVKILIAGMRPDAS